MKIIELREGWGPENLVAAERPDPSPGPGQVVLRLKAASINFRDYLMVQGGYGSTAGTLPLIPLSDGVGEGVEIGKGVTRVAVGDRVCPTFFQGWVSGPPEEGALATALGGPLDGVLCELMVLSEDGVVKVPDGLDDDAAATLPCAGLTAWNAVVGQGGVGKGDLVLIQGTGGVSIFALQFARMLGCETVITSKSDAKLERARGLGADHTINYAATPDWGKAARKLAGRRVDLVVDVGGAKTLAESLRALGVGGRIAMMGVLSGAMAQLPIASIVMRAVRLQGITVGSRADFEAMVAAIAEHDIRPVVDRTFGFGELRAALDHLEGQSHFGKICLSY